MEKNKDNNNSNSNNNNSSNSLVFGQWSHTKRPIRKVTIGETSRRPNCLSLGSGSKKNLLRIETNRRQPRDKIDRNLLQQNSEIQKFSGPTFVEVEQAHFSCARVELELGQTSPGKPEPMKHAFRPGYSPNFSLKYNLKYII